MRTNAPAGAPADNPDSAEAELAAMAAERAAAEAEAIPAQAAG
jgi:hypothetical protein